MYQSHDGSQQSPPTSLDGSLWLQVDTNNNSSAYLRHVLDTIFPPAGLSRLEAEPLRGPCSLLSVRQRVTSGRDTTQQLQLEASSEPASRASVRRLRLALKQSLREHRAKPVGLCGIRRLIYDQCFEELIRQVTVGCVEQGLLLVCVRNEFRATLAAYELAYQSALEFGLRKAVKAEVGGQKRVNSIKGLSAPETQEESVGQTGTQKRGEPQLITEAHLDDRQPLEQLKAFYETELAKKDKVIEQQRAIIRAITQEIADNIDDPGSL